MHVFGVAYSECVCARINLTHEIAKLMKMCAHYMCARESARTHASVFYLRRSAAGAHRKLCERNPVCLIEIMGNGWELKEDGLTFLWLPPSSVHDEATLPAKLKLLFMNSIPSFCASLGKLRRLKIESYSCK
jgi:hypothetical protein